MCVRACVLVYVTEWRRLDAPNFVVRRQSQSCGLPAAERRDDRQFTSTAKRRLRVATISRGFPVYLWSCSLQLLGYIMTRLDLASVLFVVLGKQGTELAVKKLRYLRCSFVRCLIIHCSLFLLILASCPLFILIFLCF